MSGFVPQRKSTAPGAGPLGAFGASVLTDMYNNSPGVLARNAAQQGQQALSANSPRNHDHSSAPAGTAGGAAVNLDPSKGADAQRLIKQATGGQKVIGPPAGEQKTIGSPAGEQRILGMKDNVFQRILGKGDKSGGGGAGEGFPIRRANQINQALEFAAALGQEAPVLRTPGYLNLYNPAARVQDINPQLAAQQRQAARFRRSAGVADPQTMAALSLSMGDRQQQQSAQLFQQQRADAAQQAAREEAGHNRQRELDYRVDNQRLEMANKAAIASAQQTNRLLGMGAGVAGSLISGHAQDIANHEGHVQQFHDQRNAMQKLEYEEILNTELTKLKGYNAQLAELRKAYSALGPEDPRREGIASQIKGLNEQVATATGRIGDARDMYMDRAGKNFMLQMEYLRRPNPLSWGRLRGLTARTLDVEGARDEFASRAKKGTKLDEREKLEMKKELALYKKKIKEADERYKRLSKNNNLVAKLVAQYAKRDLEAQMKMHEMTMKSLYP